MHIAAVFVIVLARSLGDPELYTGSGTATADATSLPCSRIRNCVGVESSGWMDHPGSRRLGGLFLPRRSPQSAVLRLRGHGDDESEWGKDMSSWEREEFESEVADTGEEEEEEEEEDNDDDVEEMDGAGDRLVDPGDEEDDIILTDSQMERAMRRGQDMMGQMDFHYSADALFKMDEAMRPGAEVNDLIDEFPGGEPFPLQGENAEKVRREMGETMKSAKEMLTRVKEEGNVKTMERELRAQEERYGVGEEGQEAGEADEERELQEAVYALTGKTGPNVTQDDLPEEVRMAVASGSKRPSKAGVQLMHEEMRELGQFLNVPSPSLETFEERYLPKTDDVLTRLKDLEAEDERGGVDGDPGNVNSFFVIDGAHAQDDPAVLYQGEKPEDVPGLEGKNPKYINITLNVCYLLFRNMPHPNTTWHSVTPKSVFS
jgi:hypothetical protein